MKRHLGLVLIVLLGLVLAACSGTTAPTPTSGASPVDEASGTDLTQTKEEAAVTVKVMPLNLDNTSAATLDFEIMLDTHSVDLGYDLTQIAVLRSDAGEEVHPVKWDGPADGGHHVSGTLSFPQLKERGQSLTLILRGVADAPERIFVWNTSN